MADKAVLDQNKINVEDLLMLEFNKTIFLLVLDRFKRIITNPAHIASLVSYHLSSASSSNNC